MAATAPTAEVRSATPGPPEATARRVPAPRAATLLLGVLLAALAYGAFAHGAAQIPEENRLQVALAVVATLACGAWLFDGGLRLHASRWGWVGVALLVAFVPWTAISLAWSVAPDRTWTEFNRAAAYAVVLVLGVALGSSHPRARELVAMGWLVVAAGVALWAPGGKVAPWIHLGPIDLNHTAGLSRLRAPLDRALALDPLDYGLLTLAGGIVNGLTPPNGSGRRRARRCRRPRRTRRARRRPRPSLRRRRRPPPRLPHAR